MTEKAPRSMAQKQHERRVAEADVQHAIEIMRRGHRITFDGKFAKLCGGVIPRDLLTKLQARVKLRRAAAGGLEIA